MTLYELIFILLFLASVVALVTGLVLWRRGGSKILLGLASIWAIYLASLAVADAFVVQKIYTPDEEQCFDEMCFAVIGADLMALTEAAPTGKASGTFYVVTVRVTSHSRGRAQAEAGVRARLYFQGSFADVSEAGQQTYEAQHGPSPRLTQRIAPGETIVSVLVFAWPDAGQQPALALDHGFTPGYFVFGESPFFHEPNVHTLPLKK